MIHVKHFGISIFFQLHHGVTQFEGQDGNECVPLLLLAISNAPSLSIGASNIPADRVTINPNSSVVYNRITSGPAIEKAGDLAALLTNLNENDILFVDEIHRLLLLSPDQYTPATSLAARNTPLHPPESGWSLQ